MKPRRVLVLGSGALKIGEAGEFDYSGSQAIKALKEEGAYVVLVNPNIATIQTSEGLADRVYLLPVAPDYVRRILEQERIDAIALSFGGQTALDCGLALAASGDLDRLGVRVLGTPVRAIRDTEDRGLFVQRLAEIGVRTARSRVCATEAEVWAAVGEIGLPVILRAGFSLGGRGSRICDTEDELRAALGRLFASGLTQVLVEESLRGWKEIEVEVVRDQLDHCITICAMENVDPLGVHTGESIVVAPTQTLTNDEAQRLRTLAIRSVRHLGIVGECNIQFALPPLGGDDYRVIEVNARLSRSSALASKATGYPLAYVAAKLAMGRTLPELVNAVTRTTGAYFEPALDYVVCKVPRWDLDKFAGVDRRIGSEMKSVGEVMAIGRTFAEALQKALRMIDVGADGLDPRLCPPGDLEEALAVPSPRRMFAVAKALDDGVPVERIAALTSIDPWFLHELAEVAEVRAQLSLDPDTLRRAKRLGFSDGAVARAVGVDEAAVRAARSAIGLAPRLSLIDTLAAEFPAETSYLYLTYAADEDDVERSTRPYVLVLGSGPYRIGSSVEFDWCSVEAVRAARSCGYDVVVLNSNPETVSTDYDLADRLVFDEITLETVLALTDRDPPHGVVVSMGGQVPNRLALALHRAGVRVLGTSAESIDRAEDRKKWSALLDQLGIDQPAWREATSVDDATAQAASVGGCPVLVRPSYVLSGAAMTVAHDPSHLRNFVQRAAEVSPDHPVVITKFETHAKEIELDAVADRGEIVLWAVSEHVENAGVHSGDATLVLPPQRLYLETIRRVRRIGQAIARALDITGPFNLQLLARNNEVKVIECNLRASRSFPFVSKVLGTSFVREATRRMLGAPGEAPVVRPLDLDYVAVKAAQFSFARLGGADPTLGVEMASTGEVGCLGHDLHEALLKALVSTGFALPSRGVLLSLGPPADKTRFLDEARALQQLGLELFATPGTADALREHGIETRVAHKSTENVEPSAVSLLEQRRVDWVVNIPREWDERGRPDGYRIRRRAVDLGIPLTTNLQLAREIVLAMVAYRGRELPVLDWRSYLARSGR